MQGPWIAASGSQHWRFSKNDMPPQRCSFRDGFRRKADERHKHGAWIPETRQFTRAKCDQSVVRLGISLQTCPRRGQMLKERGDRNARSWIIVYILRLAGGEEFNSMNSPFRSRVCTNLPKVCIKWCSHVVMIGLFKSETSQ